MATIVNYFEAGTVEHPWDQTQWDETVAGTSSILWGVNSVNLSADVAGSAFIYGNSGGVVGSAMFHDVVAFPASVLPGLAIYPVFLIGDNGGLNTDMLRVYWYDGDIYYDSTVGGVSDITTYPLQLAGGNQYETTGTVVVSGTDVDFSVVIVRVSDSVTVYSHTETKVDGYFGVNLHPRFQTQIGGASAPQTVYIEGGGFPYTKEGPTLTKQPTKEDMSVTATGEAPLQYQWYDDSVLVVGQTTDTYTLALVESHSYYVVVSNSIDTVTSDTVTIPVAPPVPPPTSSGLTYGNTGPYGSLLYKGIPAKESFTKDTLALTIKQYRDPYFNSGGSTTKIISPISLIPKVNSLGAGTSVVDLIVSQYRDDYIN